MAQILRIRDARYHPQDLWDTLGTLGTRRDLLETESIFSPNITFIDAWLVKQPDVPLSALIQIWSRCMYCFLDIYLDPDVDDDTKHRLLLHMKAHWQEYRRMPQRVQDLLAPMWGNRTRR
jgi:hypothetical protein